MNDAIQELIEKLMGDDAKIWRQAINNPRKPPTALEIAELKCLKAKRIIDELITQITEQRFRIRQLEAALTDAGLPVPPRM